MAAIFSHPAPGNLEWRKIEALFVALGAEVIEGDGSRVLSFSRARRLTFIALIRARKPNVTRCETLVIF